MQLRYLISFLQLSISLGVYATESKMNSKPSDKTSKSLELEELDIRKSEDYENLTGCSCYVDDKVYVQGSYGGSFLLIQINDKIEKLATSKKYESKRVKVSKSKYEDIFSFQVSNDKYVANFTCKDSEGSDGDIKCKPDDEKCEVNYQRCDIELSTKDGQQKKSYKNLKGECAC